MKTKEEILAEWTHTYPEIKKYVIEAMEAYASQQTEKYKELVKSYELYREWLGVDIVKCKNAWDKIKQLKTELGL